MLVSLQKLKGITIEATDGDVGQVKDILFDDRFWTIRFLVVDPHPWIPLSQKVLISPIVMNEINVEDSLLTLSIDKEAVENGPKLEEHEPVSREFEKMYFDHFGLGYYWTGAGAWGEYAYPTALFNQDAIAQASSLTEEAKKANHLRSANEIGHYGIEAIDGIKGHVKDLIWDTHSWTLRFFVIDTRDWLPGGKKVLISPEQLDTLNWGSQTVSCNIDLAKVKACPEYHAEKLNDPQYLEHVKEVLQPKEREK